MIVNSPLPPEPGRIHGRTPLLADERGIDQEGQRLTYAGFQRAVSHHHFNLIGDDLPVALDFGEGRNTIELRDFKGDPLDRCRPGGVIRRPLGNASPVRTYERFRAKAVPYEGRADYISPGRVSNHER